MEKMIRIIFGAVVFLISYDCFSQDPPQIYPEVGKTCPYFAIKNIKDYKNDIATSEDLKGEWLILDFWSKYCGACVENFPNTNNLQKEYKDKIQFVLVGLEDKENEIRNIYDKFRKKEALQLAYAFDSSLFNAFAVAACPHLVIIDDKGIVRGITSEINAEQIDAFLNGKTPLLERVYSNAQTGLQAKYKFNDEAPLLLNNNGGADTSYRFRSVLSAWAPGEMPIVISRSLNSDEKYHLFQLSGVSLGTLFNYALVGRPYIGWGDSLYGKYLGKPIFSSIDSSQFIADYASGRNVYCYSFSAPDSGCREKQITDLLQSYLKNCLRLNAKVESRMVPCWKLVADRSFVKKFKAKDNKTSYKYFYHTGFKVTNFSIGDFLGLIWAEHQDELFFDCTNISDKIDLELNCIMPDLIDVRNALKLVGFDLVRDTATVKAIIISKAE